MQLRARLSFSALQHQGAATRSVATPALSPRDGTGLRRPTVTAQSAAVLEAVQEGTVGTGVADFVVPLQQGAVQTTPLSTGDFHKMFSLGETLGQVRGIGISTGPCTNGRLQFMVRQLVMDILHSSLTSE